MRIIIIIIITMFIFLTQSYASDFYIKQSASGNGNGSSCDNAHALSGLTWGAGNDVAPGDTLHLCGTFTSYLTIGASGTDNTTNRITIKFEDGAKFSATVVSAIYGAIFGSNKSYILIDGGTNGIIENTDNGSGKSNKTFGIGINLESCNYVEIKNLTIQNLYVHTYQSDDGANTWDNYGAVYLLGGSNILVHDNTISDAYTAVSHCNVGGGTNSNIQVYNNTVSACCWGIQAWGSGATSVTDSMKIYNNTIVVGTNWDAGAGDDCHTNVGHFFSEPYYQWSMTNLEYYNNYIYAPPTQSATGSAGIRINYLGTGSSSNKVYNNLIVFTPTYFPTEAAINFGNTRDSSPSAYNNTIIGYGTGVTGGIGINYAANGITGSPNIKNNIITNVLLGISVESGSAICDQNIVYSVGSAGTSCDANTSNPNLDSVTYKPTVSSTNVINQGAVLNSIFTTDKDGAIRGSTWDIGAYEYGGGGGGSGLTIPGGVTIR